MASIDTSELIRVYKPPPPHIPSALIRATLQTMKHSTDNGESLEDFDLASVGFNQTADKKRLSQLQEQFLDLENERHLVKANKKTPASVLDKHKRRYSTELQQLQLQHQRRVSFEDEVEGAGAQQGRGTGDLVDNVYRGHAERRMAFAVVGDHQRIGQKQDAGGGSKSGTEEHRVIYPEGAPLDFSFCLLSTIDEISTGQETPSNKRNHRLPEVTEDERWKTSSLRLSYNMLESVEGLLALLYKWFDGGPAGLCWLDLSFNSIAAIEDETVGNLPNLRILYLHCNEITDMYQVMKLQQLPKLKTLTLHGNPIDQNDGYRPSVLHYLPNLKSLDFSTVTKSDKANAKQVGSFYEPTWQRKHRDWESHVKKAAAAQQMSYTEEIMQLPESKVKIF